MLRLGVVGAGVGGGHGAAIHQSGKAELAAFCEIDPAKLEKRLTTYAAEIGAHPTGYTDYTKMLKEARLDGVVISTPSSTHHKLAIEAAQHKVHILADKPLDITVENIDKIAAAVAANGVLCGVNFQQRCQPIMYTLKQAIVNGDFGQLLIVDCRLKWYRDQAYYDAGGWRGSWAFDGGGSMMNQGVHPIDLVTWFVGARPKRVSGQYAALDHKIETEDWAAGVVEFENGVRSVINTTTCAAPKISRTWLEVHGTKGSAFVYGDAITETNIESLKTVLTPPFSAPVLDFIDAIEKKRAPMVDIEQGRRSVQLITAIYQSAREGRRLEL